MSLSRGFAVVTACSTVCLSSCVFNPYIETPSPSYAGNDLCRKSFDATERAPEAIPYAQCTRQAMEAKAGTYALMNNGGSAFLLGLAGLATYRAFQGGNEANVAALTTGGAVMYGAQQYLYKKPREAIYFVGASAISCAIGITRRRQQIPVSIIKSQLADIDVAGVENALYEARRYQDITPNAQCPSAIQSQWNEAADLLRKREGLVAVESLRDRARVARERIDRLEEVSLLASHDLVTVTDKVRESVNYQLALQQPDPTAIAASIAGLKLATLQGASTPSKSATDEAASETAEAAGRAADVLFTTEPPKSPNCNVDAGEVTRFAAAVRAYQRNYTDADFGLTSLESRLGRLESGGVGGIDDMRKNCPIGQPPSLVPFGIALAQPGPQSLKQGASVVIPIEGGVPPFSAVPAATSKPADLTAVATAVDGGGFQFVVSASTEAAAGVYSIIATDASGLARVFQVEVVEVAKDADD